MTPNFEYTQNNHYKWGFGDQWYNLPIENGEFKIQLGYCTRTPMRFRDECINAAKLIAASATKPIIVGLSGGSDSQMVCLSFMTAGIKIKAVIVRMLDNGNLINGHDIATAYKFCEKFNIEYIEHILDIDEFFIGPALDYVKKYGFTLLETIVQCSTMDFVCKDYCYIMGGGDIIFSIYNNRDIPDVEFAKLFDNSQLTVPIWSSKSPPVMQHMISMSYEGTSKFFLYTPELIYSYLTDPAVTDFINAQDVIYTVYLNWHKSPKMWWRCFHLLYKPLMTIREWPEMIKVRKFTGFEYMEGYIKGEMYGVDNMQKYRDAIKSVNKLYNSNREVIVPIGELIQYLSTKHTHNLHSVVVGR